MESVEEQKFNFEQNEALHNFTLLIDKFSPEQMQLTKVNELPDTYIIYNGFSDEECEENIKYEQDVQFSNRMNLRSQVTNPELADKIFNIIKEFLPQKHVVEEHREQYGQLSKGEWKPMYLNQRIRINKYLNGGYFKPHYDGYHIVSHEKLFHIDVLFK
jgi:hypothetical protein